MATLSVCYAALPSSPVKVAFAAVIVSAVIVGLTKLPIFFDQDTGRLRDFGTAPHETILPAWMAMMAVGYFVYMMVSATKLLS
jgi:hypothetical protein